MTESSRGLLRIHAQTRFCSRRTLTRLLEGTGLAVEGFPYAGQLRPLAKSMIAVARRLESGESPQVQKGG